MMNFFLKQMLKKQLSALPEEQKQRVLKALEENPKFFEELVKEISERLKKGESQQSAIMQVMTARKAELQKILQS